MSMKALVPTNVPVSATDISTPTLQTGDLYFNTTTGLRVYNGTAWTAAGSGGGITGVTAGAGLTGGGTSGTVTLAVNGTVIYGYTTTATAAGTTTLTNASTTRQFFTGTTTQTVVLPVASTLILGASFKIRNNSTGALTVNSSGGNLIVTIPAGLGYVFTCILTSGTTAASWDADFEGSSTITGTGSNALSISPTFTGTPLSTTAAVDTNTTQIATTAFVVGQASGSNPLALGSVAQGTSFRYSRQDHVHPTTGLGLTSGTLAQFSATTSSQLAGVISDETGSGSLVFGTTPTIATPLLTLSSTTSTTAGRIAWDNTNDQIVIGDGTVTKRFSADDDKIQFVPSLFLGGM